jgi:hypothetical protein
MFLSLTVGIRLIYPSIRIVVTGIETILSLGGIKRRRREIPDGDGVEVDARLRISHRLDEQPRFSTGVIGIADPIDEPPIDED